MKQTTQKHEGGDVTVLVTHHGYEFRERVYRYKGQSEADFARNLRRTKDALRLFALRCLAPIRVGA